MNYHNLKKQATPRPYKRGIGQAAEATAFLYSKEGLARGWAPVNEEGHLLAAHCVNNFDRALEALKDCRGYFHRNPQVTGSGTQKARLDQLISELEEVK